MPILVVGGTGATGKQVVEQLLNNDFQVRAVVRNRNSVPEHIRDHPNLELMEASLLKLDETKIKELVAGCTGIISCLGHNLSFGGIFGPPFRLVTRAVKQLTAAVESPERPVKFILMNTVAVKNTTNGEKRSMKDGLVTGILRILLPPQADNEQAVKYLHKNIGTNNPNVEWVAVRPDTLIDEDEVTDYTLHESPTRSGIFDPGKTSRINIGHFMVELLQDDDLWNSWKGKMPVIYNVEE